MALRSGLLVELLVGLLCVSIAHEFEVEGGGDIHAICTIKKGSGIGKIHGTVKMHQKLGHDIHIDVSLFGFDTSVRDKRHGFHIHEGKSIGHKCNDSGLHYNPDNVDHGGPNDQIRHEGDLGNLEVDGEGEVSEHLTDHIITLFGERSVLHRSFVVHEKVDDLGKGNFPDSKTVGHSGRRLGCCIIEKE